jgi:type I restriction enzyme S subunit
VKGLFPGSFVFSDELGKWVPEGWAITTLENSTTELRRGLTPKYIDEGGILVLNQKCIRNHEVNFNLGRRNDTSTRKVDGRLLQLHDVLVNSTGMGTLGRIAQLNRLEEPAIVDTHVTVIRPNPESYSPLVFGRLLLSMERLIESMGEGSTGQTELKRAKVSELSVLTPPIEIQEVIETKLKALVDKSSENQQEIQTLTRLRDVLLPELISGRLGV